ncbi:MAG: hypothetical protein EP329_24260 [Deltaproteobacteria bacterium]|nr:MAG: hypothetical protein EP329_24260 [Deltaproteobacteria bacterium]
MLRKIALFTLSTLAVGLMACGDDTSGNTDTGADAIFPDIIGADADTTQLPDTNQTQAVRRLEFDQAFGDDQVACKGTDHCTISISYVETRSLKVVYTEDGATVSGQVVKFALENDNDSVGFISSLSSVTDESGIAQIETKAKQSHVGQFGVKAYVDNSDIPALHFDVVVTPKGQVPLTVFGSYAGNRPVGNYSVRLYKQNTAGVPNCANLLDLYENATAAQSKDNIQLTQSAKFPDFDNLETESPQKYTIFLFSKNQNDAIQAWGCDDQSGIVEWAKTATVEVEMLDRPPVYAGAYNITSRFDFISAIPEPYGTWVGYVVGFFQSPTQTVFELACDLLGGFEDQQLQGFCGTLFTRGPDGDVQPGTIGGFVFDLVDDILNGAVQGTTFGNVLQAGGDVADILKAFEISATLTFKKEPNEAGQWAAADTTENWHTVKVKWTLGANCDPNTEVGCGVRSFNMSAIQQQAVTGSFSASVADYWKLTIDPHPLNLHYGALINYFLEKFLLPVVTGQEVVDTYEELLGFLIGGGVACLQPTAGALDCCGTFADGTVGDESGQIDSGTETAVNAACNAIASAGPSFLRNTLTNLDLNTGDVFTIGTKSACMLTDFDNDMIVDGVGSQSTPCLWDVLLDFGGGSSTRFDAIFWGARAE